MGGAFDQQISNTEALGFLAIFSPLVPIHDFSTPHTTNGQHAQALARCSGAADEAWRSRHRIHSSVAVWKARFPASVFGTEQSSNNRLYSYTWLYQVIL